MAFELDYGQLIFLDAEDLAESGIKEAYESLLPTFRHYVPEPADVEEQIDNDTPSYAIVSGGKRYEIYGPNIHDAEERCWGLAAFAFFSIVNAQLADSDHRFYAINGGNDLAGMFLTNIEVEAAKRSLHRKLDWPYLPTSEHPWYGQHY